MRWPLVLVALLGLAGCDQIFGLHVRDSDASVDADVGIDASSCSMPTVFEAFDNSGGPPCTVFGASNDFSVATVVRNGAFEVTPDPTAANSLGGCLSLAPIPFTAAGLFAEISAVGTGTKEYTVLFANWEGSGGERSAMNSSGGTLSYGRDGMNFTSVAYDAISMRWWRMRPTVDGIIAEYSADGISWTLLAFDATTPPAKIRIEFDIGTFDVEPTAGTAVFEGINVCP